ncbi:MOSC domain-containing protein [Aquabacterium sp.]|uniref:MOSC domain-containing protein n=1 Tax=Aquabacterium sp. TaxID=1872578 RepID=UPI003783CC33
MRAVPHVVSVNVALASPLLIDGQSVLTGIRKQPVAMPVAVQPMGLAGDEQADLSVHGGLTKAVYAYPLAHYPFWQTVRAQARVAAPDAVLPPGAMGENLTIAGLLEDQLWIGDRLRLPGCELAVSEPRFPCFKFNAVMGFNQAAKLMTQSGYCGSYLAVMQPGQVQAGDEIELIPGPREVNIRELFRARMGRKASA